VNPIGGRCNPAPYLEVVSPLRRSRARRGGADPTSPPRGTAVPAAGLPCPAIAGAEAGTDADGREGSHHEPRTVPYLRSVAGDRYPDWEAIYLDNVERIYRVIYSRVGNRPDAEDLTAEVFHAALGPLRITASKGEVRAYLLATSRTVLASHWRRRYGAEITAIDLEGDQAALDEAPTESLAPQRVARILAALPERYGRILELRFLESCSIREAAGAMNVSVANAKVLQHRALRYAAQLFEEAL
jgi:RNA polymerase sigma factor (sigma-70 family)